MRDRASARTACLRPSFAIRPQVLPPARIGVFRIKICGITRPADAEAALAAGADAIGLNFYGPSPRFVAPEAAGAIAAAVAGRVPVVGVFVNAATDEIVALAEAIRLDAVQLHGDETPAECTRLAAALAQAREGGFPARIVRAFRLADPAIGPVEEYLAACQALAPGKSSPIEAVLFDAARAGSYGGTGEPANWEAAARWVAEHPEVPLILAGGLNPENVGDAIRAVHPWGVDTASGVELSPGVKDRECVRLFVENARRALVGG